MDRIAKHLDVHPDFLSGEYDKSIENIENEYIRNSLKSQIKIEKFPYCKKEQEKIDYKEYLMSILFMHDISMTQFLALSVEQRNQLQLDIEKAIVTVMTEHFDCDAMGRKNFPDLGFLEMEIVNAEEDIFQSSYTKSNKNKNSPD